MRIFIVSRIIERTGIVCLICLAVSVSLRAKEPPYTWKEVTRHYAYAQLGKAELSVGSARLRFWGKGGQARLTYPNPVVADTSIVTGSGRKITIKLTKWSSPSKHVLRGDPFDLSSLLLGDSARWVGSGGKVDTFQVWGLGDLWRALNGYTSLRRTEAHATFTVSRSQRIIHSSLISVRNLRDGYDRFLITLSTPTLMQNLHVPQRVDIRLIAPPLNEKRRSMLLFQELSRESEYGHYIHATLASFDTIADNGNRSADELRAAYMESLVKTWGLHQVLLRQAARGNESTTVNLLVNK